MTSKAWKITQHAKLTLLFVALKVPTKIASENVVYLCLLLHTFANIINLCCKMYGVYLFHILFT